MMYIFYLLLVLANVGTISLLLVQKKLILGSGRFYARTLVPLMALLQLVSVLSVLVIIVFLVLL